MVHRKLKHTGTVAYCSNYLKGSCIYSNKMCWWNHEAQPDFRSGNVFKCYDCGETFDERRKMMVHKKNSHNDSTRLCNLFIDGKCMYNDDSCWYKHESNMDDKSEEEERADEDPAQSVFQKVRENLQPPE